MARRGGLTEEGLREAALRHLERYATSTANLRRVLSRRIRRRAEGDAEAEAAMAHVEKILARFQEVGLLDDRAYADRRAEALHRKGKALRAIQADLLGKGVPRNVADETVADLRERLGGTPDLSAAVTYARKRRLGPFRTSGDRSLERERDAARLARRGFGWDVVRRVIDARDPEDLTG